MPPHRLRRRLVVALRVAALVAAAGLGWGPIPAATSASPSPARAGPASPVPVTLSADHISVDTQGTTLSATGHVAAAYGALRVTSDALRIDRPTGTATFSGRVAVTDPKGRAAAQEVTVSVTDGEVTLAVLSGRASVESPRYALRADRITADRRRNRLEATGNVTLLSHPDLIATGTGFSYDEGARHAVLRGDAATLATVQNRDGRIRGMQMEGFLDEGIVVVTGSVVVSRREGTLLADRVTVYYWTRRFVAEGTTHATIRDLEGSP